MKVRHGFARAGRVWLLLSLWLVAASAMAADVPVSAIPADRLDQPWWAQRHADVLQQVQAHPDAPLLLIGDSITQNYEKAKAPDEDFLPTRQAFYGARGRSTSASAAMAPSTCCGG